MSLTFRLSVVWSVSRTIPVDPHTLLFRVWSRTDCLYRLKVSPKTRDLQFPSDSSIPSFFSGSSSTFCTLPLNYRRHHRRRLYSSPTFVLQVHTWSGRLGFQIGSRSTGRKWGQDSPVYLVRKEVEEPVV